MIVEHQHQHEFTEEDEAPEDTHTVIWREDSATEAAGVHAKAVSKIQAARDLTTPSRSLEGFSNEFNKVIWLVRVLYVCCEANVYQTIAMLM